MENFDNKKQPSMEQPYVIQQFPPECKEPETCTTLRNQFPIMWKICLIYGICYLLFAYQNYDGIGSGIFAAVSAAFLLLIAKRLKEHPAEDERSLSICISWQSIFYFVAAVCISTANCLTDSWFFLFFNHVGSFLLFSITCIKMFYNDRKWDFGKYTAILFSYWIQVLSVIPVPFQDFRYYRKKPEKRMSATTCYVLIGIAAGLPILLITTMLLASADQIFSDLLEHIFNFNLIKKWLINNLPQNIILLPFSFILYTLLLYLVSAALCKGSLKEDIKEARIFGTPIAVTIFVMIDIIYVIFVGIQFLFLFSGCSLASYEYAEYAREGFFELLFVALINFFLVLFCNKHFTKNIALKTVMTITCLCTFVMIISSAYRMRLYIHEYHLTFLRVFVLWFLLLLTFFMIGCTISIYKENWNSFHYCLFVLTCFYTIFSLSNVDAKIARYNVAQFEADLNLNYSQIPYLDNYLPYDYTSSKAYAKALFELKQSYEDQLDDTTLGLIDNYFSMENLFYEYDIMGDFVLEESANLYDSDLPKNIFTWKHYNFIEKTCYQKCKDNVTIQK